MIPLSVHRILANYPYSLINDCCHLNWLELIYIQSFVLLDTTLKHSVIAPCLAYLLCRSLHFEYFGKIKVQFRDMFLCYFSQNFIIFMYSTSLSWKACHMSLEQLVNRLNMAHNTLGQDYDIYSMKIDDTSRKRNGITFRHKLIQ